VTGYGDVPFAQAIQFYRAKLNLQQSPKWADMLHEQHTNAFTVAGACNDAILTDFHQAVDKAISQGTTLEDFRKDFDRIVSTHGWSYNGTRGWRSRLIYQTNVTVAYAAGRYHQMTDPDVTRYRPFWRYVHDDTVKDPRHDHLAWNGLVLAHDDPWWKTHYPPNGWGCHCTVEPITRRDLAKLGKKGPDTAPPLKMRQETLNTSAGPITVDVPKGIDPGWGYRPGSGAALKIPREEEAKDAVQGSPVDKAVNLTPGDWKTNGRPERIPRDPLPAPLGKRIHTLAETQRQIERVIGGPTGALRLPTGHGVVIDAEEMARHMIGRGKSFHVERTAFIPLIKDLLADPYEIWAYFTKLPDGTIMLKQNLVRAFDVPEYQNAVLIAKMDKGWLREVTFFPTDDDDYVNRRIRIGKLIYRR
jgi:hypothetical protein